MSENSDLLSNPLVIIAFRDRLWPHHRGSWLGSWLTSQISCNLDWDSQFNYCWHHRGGSRPGELGFAVCHDWAGINWHFCEYRDRCQDRGSGCKKAL